MHVSRAGPQEYPFFPTHSSQVAQVPDRTLSSPLPQNSLLCSSLPNPIPAATPVSRLLLTKRLGNRISDSQECGEYSSRRHGRRTEEDRGGDRAEAFTLLNKAVFLMAWTSSGASGGSRYLSLVSSQFCLYKT